MSIFDNWNKLKKSIDNGNKKVFFKERDIFYISLGQNIGYEENGKGKNLLELVHDLVSN